MRIASWNTNCGWRFKDEKKAQEKVNHLIRTVKNIDLAFLMEHPKCAKLLNAVAIVKDTYFKEGRFEEEVSKDTRTAGLYLPADSAVEIIGHQILAPANINSFIMGYVAKWKGEIFHIACLWNYIPKDCKDNDYVRNIGEMLNSSQNFLQESKNSILIGDFNISAFHYSRQRKMHEEEYSFLHDKIENGLKLRWLDCDVPEEKKRTFYPGKGDNGLAIDFCAVSPSLQKRSELIYGKWEKFVKKEGDKPSFSDHVPLILKID